ncbi:MAG: hypothetical protein H0V70_09885 [Ktedonobacteraceae bacterium]|nr:hypothetical protein [Ktedonobacteraceae bacterium]
MAVTLLTEEEYQFLTEQHKSLVEKAKTASPRAATHLRTIAKMHSDFLALENGKRAASTTKAQARKEREAEKLQRQQERLTALQKKMQEQPKADAQGTTGQAPAGQRQDRPKASATA